MGRVSFLSFSSRVFWVFKFCSSWVLNRTFVWHFLVNFGWICQWITSNISFFSKITYLGWVCQKGFRLSQISSRVLTQPIPPSLKFFPHAWWWADFFVKGSVSASALLLGKAEKGAGSDYLCFLQFTKLKP